jgi:CYTH domain-containing protein
VAWEIKRRFVVRVSDALWYTLGEGHHYRQGYMRNGEPSVRIRTGEPRGAVLTCKGGSAIRREEMETVVPANMAVRLLGAAEDRIIEKILWKLGPWKLDRFLGTLDGLSLMEIELDEESDPLPKPPQVVQSLREVPKDNRSVRSHLARMTPKNQCKLV